MPDEPTSRVATLSATVHPERRIRSFVVQDATRKPAIGVPFRVYFEVTADEPDHPAQYNVGFFEADHVGYLSFDVPSPSEFVPRAGEQPAPPKLYLETLEEPVVRTELSPDRELFEPIVADSFSRSAPHIPVYPSIPRPDVRDWELSPASFLNRVPLPVIGADGCEELLHNTYPEEIFRFCELYRQPGEPESLWPAPKTECEVNEFEEDARMLCIRRGAIFEYEIEWSPRGHSLGEIAYSATLAPCEHINLAIIDWSREDRAIRADTAYVSEALIHDLRRDRIVEETTQFAIQERQYGGSIMGALGGSYGGGSYGLAGGIGGGYATTSGRRSGSAQATQTLADQIAQASSSARSLRQTVVVQASAREQNVLQTRTIRNHNHCHALTVLYYEILRHYIVTTKLIDKSDVVLVKFPVRAFTLDDLSAYRWILEPALLDPTLAKCFEDVAVPELVVPSPPASPTAPAGEVRSFNIEITTGSDGTDSDVYFRVRLNDGTIREFGGDLDTPGTDNFEAGARDPFTRDGEGVRIEDIRQVGVRFDYRATTLGPAWRFGGMRVDCEVEGTSELIRLFDNPEINRQFDSDGEWWGDVARPAVASDAVAGTAATPPAEPRCAEVLLAHINANGLYYSAMLWLRGDPNVNGQLLERYSYDHTDAAGVTVHGRLADFVDLKPVGLSGRYVAFRIDSNRIADTLASPQPALRVVSLPTRGVFAELKLSHCSGCEKVDPTRFWDWQESPCPDEAPALAPISQTQAQVRPDLTPAAMPGAVLGIQQPPEAPALGQLLQGVLDVMKSSDVFRDMSAKEQVAALVQTAIEAAVEANKAQVDLEKARLASGASAQGAPGRRQTAGQEARDAVGIIDSEQREGHITPEQGASAREDVNAALVERIAPGTGGAGTPARRPRAASRKELRFEFADGVPMFGQWRTYIRAVGREGEIAPTSLSLSIETPPGDTDLTDLPFFREVGNVMFVAFDMTGLGSTGVNLFVGGMLYVFRTPEEARELQRLFDIARGDRIITDEERESERVRSGWVPLRAYQGHIILDNDDFRTCPAFLVKLPKRESTVTISRSATGGSTEEGSLSITGGREELNGAISVGGSRTREDTSGRSIEEVSINYIPARAALQIIPNPRGSSGSD